MITFRASGALYTFCVMILVLKDTNKLRVNASHGEATAFINMAI